MAGQFLLAACVFCVPSLHYLFRHPCPGTKRPVCSGEQSVMKQRGGVNVSEELLGLTTGPPFENLHRQDHWDQLCHGPCMTKRMMSNDSTYPHRGHGRHESYDVFDQSEMLCCFAVNRDSGAVTTRCARSMGWETPDGIDEVRTQLYGCQNGYFLTPVPRQLLFATAPLQHSQTRAYLFLICGLTGVQGNSLSHAIGTNAVEQDQRFVSPVLVNPGCPS